MTEITLLVTSPQGTMKIPLAAEPLTVGRTSASQLVIDSDNGLSRRHATLRREGDQVLVNDEGSTNGTFLNGEPVAAEGRPVADGDEIRVGNYTTIRVLVGAQAQAPGGNPAASSAAPPPQAQAPAPSSSFPYMIVLPVVALLLLALIGAGLYIATASSDGGRTNARDEYANTRKANDSADADSSPSDAEESETDTPAKDEPEETAAALQQSVMPQSVAPTPVVATSLANEAPIVTPDFAQSQPPPAALPSASVKLYQKMSDEEKRDFIKQHAQRVAVMMGRRPYAIPPEAVDEIKKWLDAFSNRIGNNGTRLWGGDTRFIFQRARSHAPAIIAAFKEENVPPVIGLYIPFIETEYTNITTENFAGAAGLFQFIAPTAKAFGVDPAERTNVAKMAPAAARYFRNNIMMFGNDPMSVALSIAGYNRNPESVMRDMRNVLSEQDNTAKERTFWTLIANKGKLDSFFQNENKNYVPRFFAAAIMGETPWAFGLDMRPLSTYTQPDPAAATAQAAPTVSTNAKP